MWFLLIGSFCVDLGLFWTLALSSITSRAPSNGPKWSESQARTGSLSLQPTGLSATWRPPSSAQHPADRQRGPWQGCEPRPGSLKGRSTSDRTADGITQHYVLTGWIIHAIKTSSSQLNEHTYAPAERAPKHLICHLGQELRQAFTGRLTSHMQLHTRSQ